jgi:microcystin-dependent protein
MLGRGSGLVSRVVVAGLVAATAGVATGQAPAGAATPTPVVVSGPSLALTPFVPVVGAAPSATVDSGGAPLGAIRTMSGNFTVADSVAAAGETLSATTYPSGPAVFGSTFGGDGSTTFAVPDLQGRTPVGAGTGPGLTTVAQGEQLGANSVAVTSDELPVAYGGAGAPFSRRPPSLGLTYLIRTAGRDASANIAEFDSVGVVVPYAGSVIPAGWTPADGRLLAPTDYPTLFSIIGTTYGGDGVTTFALPDLRGRAAVQAGCGPGLPCRALGEQYGTEAVTITASQLPTAIGGGGQTLNNDAPSLALNYLCNLEGPYPPRGAGYTVDPVEPYIGEVVLYAGAAPDEDPTCSAQQLSINQWQALFSIMGTTYGGNGQTTFQLPDLRNRMAIGTGSGAGLDSVILGEEFGWDLSGPLTTANLPAPLVPGTPTGVIASASDGQVALSWSAPISNGGSPITGYVVTPYLGAAAQPPVTEPSAPTAATITGLTDGATYTFTVAATNAVGSGAASTASDPVVLPTVSIGDATVVEGDGGNANVSFPVRLSSAQAGPVTVHYSTANGTAQAPSDYVAKNQGTLTIPAGKTAANIVVVVKGDRRPEPDETFTVNLSAPTGAGLGRASATGTIIDNDPNALPAISIGDASVVEGDTGTSRAVFDVTLDHASASTVTVPWATAAGTAKAGPDYVTASGTLSFPAGTTSLTVGVVVKGDTVVEPDETATVNLGVPTGATIADGTGTLTILNDDAGAATAIGIGDVAVSEGNALNHNAAFTIRLANAAPAGGVTVHYATAPGTATPTADYTTKTGTATIGAGADFTTVGVPVVADGLTEANETFTVTLSAPTGGATLGRSIGTATIIDDDPPSAIVSIGEGSAVEGASGSAVVRVPITLTEPSATPVTVLVNSANGSAKKGSDYTGVVNRLVTIPAGATNADVLVTIKGDTTVEPDETFTLSLSSPSGATIGRATGTYVILDDD